VAWTKREFVLQAFAEIGLASYVYDLAARAAADGAEQSRRYARDLECRTASAWATRFRPRPSSSDLDQNSSGVPDAANEAIYLNLAIRIASSVGKTPSAELKENGLAAYNSLLLAQFAFPMERQLPRNFPAGAGNKPWLYEQPFLAPPTDPVTTGGDGRWNSSRGRASCRPSISCPRSIRFSRLTRSRSTPRTTGTPERRPSTSSRSSAGEPGRLGRQDDAVRRAVVDRVHGQRAGRRQHVAPADADRSLRRGDDPAPGGVGVQDRQELLVNCTQAVTTLAVSGNGATVTGAPTTLAANAFFRLRFDQASSVWYRVG
jgi:hypothetical protein